MTVQELSNLSKHKKLYVMYIGKDGIINYEVYPVPYLNAEYTYYIKPGSSMLEYLRTELVVESFQTKIDKLGLNELYRLLKQGYRAYAWSHIGADKVGAVLKEQLEIMTNFDIATKKVESLKRDIEWSQATHRSLIGKTANLEANIAKLTEQYNIAVTELEKAKKELERMNEK